MAALGRLWARVLGGRCYLLQPPAARPLQLRAASLLSGSLRHRLALPPAGAGPACPWSRQQIRARARGNEYQPNNRKRKRTHGWIKRISTPGGVAVILRRMLKGRKSLTH